MGSLEIFGALKESGAFDGNLFRPMNYRMALFILSPDPMDLERFVRASLRQALKHTESVLSLMSPATTEGLLGDEASAIRIGVQRATRIADHLDPNAPDVEAELMGTRTFFQDVIVDEASRLHGELSNLRMNASARLEAFPERMTKHLGLAEVSLAQYLVETEENQGQYIDDAVARLYEIVDQPVGSRDAFCWLLYGWTLSLRDGFTHEAMNALSHASLTSSAIQDCLFQEAHRMLAHAQSLTGSIDTAYQSIRKAVATGTTSETLLELARYSAGSHRKTEAQEFFQSALQAQPMNFFSMFVDPDMLVQANTWAPMALTLNRDRNEAAMRALNRWAQSLEALSAVDQSTELEFELDPSFAISHNSLSLQLENAGMFDAAFVCSEAERLERDTLSTAIKDASAINDSIVEASHLAAGNMEAMRMWKRDSIDAIQSRQQSIKHKARIDLGLYQAVSDRMQTGCVFSLGAGCLGYSFYFTLSVVWASFAVWGGPQTQNGKWIVAALSLPLVIGTVSTLVDAGRKLKAQAELRRRTHQVDIEADAAIQEINRQYELQMPMLQQALDEAKSRVAVSEALVREVRSVGKHLQQAA